MKYLLVVLLFVGFVVIVIDNTGKDYWENVGPNWDKMLNPCKFELCEK